jgi:hypothetical protein
LAPAPGLRDLGELLERDPGARRVQLDHDLAELDRLALGLVNGVGEPLDRLRGVLRPVEVDQARDLDALLEVHGGQQAPIAGILLEVAELREGAGLARAVGEGVTGGDGDAAALVVEGGKDEGELGGWTACWFLPESRRAHSRLDHRTARARRRVQGAGA